MVYGLYVAAFFSFRVVFYLYFSFTPRSYFWQRPSSSTYSGAINRFHGFDCAGTHTAGRESRVGSSRCLFFKQFFLLLFKVVQYAITTTTRLPKNRQHCARTFCYYYNIYYPHLYVVYVRVVHPLIQRDGLQKPGRCAPHVQRNNNNNNNNSGWDSRQKKKNVRKTPYRLGDRRVMDLQLKNSLYTFLLLLLLCYNTIRYRKIFFRIFFFL